MLDPVRMISAVIVDIAFPAFAKLRHTKDRLIAQFVSFTRLNLITVMAYSAVVLVAAEDVVHVFFPKYAGAETAVRILCIVAVLRAVSFVVPPLLDGVGKPERTFTYMVTAAIALPLCYVVGAEVLGDRFGFVSVAIAWAVGYPIAFAVLMFMATATLGWSVRQYLRSIAGVASCMIGAGLVALGVHRTFGHHFSPGVRLAIITGVVVLVAGLLLAYTQGISLRSAKRALSADAPPPPLPDQAAT